MADTDLSPAPPADAHPMANPGYGKRTAPHERPRSAQDFAHLPQREASIATLIDRLPDGAAVSGKALAQVHPLYGQAACLTALRRLSEAGHLRRANEHVVRPDGSRWVTRTYFSRTARNDGWWTDFLTGRLPEEPSSAPRRGPREEAASEPSSPAGADDEGREPEPRPSPAPVRPTTSRSSAYDALASLGRTEPRLTLSAADCAALETMAAEWLARDPSVPCFVHVLTAGLPPEVHSARGLLRTRLRAKLPPEAPVRPEPAPTAFRLVECTTCRVPGRPEALPGGLCGPCRGEPRAGNPSPAIDVHARVASIRTAIRAGTRAAARSGAVRLGG